LTRSPCSPNSRVQDAPVKSLSECKPRGPAVKMIVADTVGRGCIAWGVAWVRHRRLKTCNTVIS
jgi:hypothetical protein